MADPGLPETIANSIADDLVHYLSENLDTPNGEQEWKVRVAQGTLPTTENRMVPLLDHAEQIQESNGWDYLFYLLDLPQWHDDQPMAITDQVCGVDLPAPSRNRRSRHPWTLG